MKSVKIFLLVVLLGSLGSRIYQYRERYLTPFDPGYWEGRYLRSQWVDPLSQESIGDDGLYTHAGWEYVHGRDPTTLNAETPPLGKYLIGVTEVIFHNQNTFALISGIAALVAFYQLSALVLPGSIWPLLAVVVFSLEPLFGTQLRAPFLDTLFLFFLLTTFYFFLRKRFFLSSLFLGLFVATKFPFLGLLVVEVIGFSLFLDRDKDGLKSWLLSLPVAFLAYLLVHFRFFQVGGDLTQFLKVQKWVVNFYLSGDSTSLGGVLTLVLFNRQPLWWKAGIQKASSFNLSWPILFFTYLFSFGFWLSGFLRKKGSEKQSAPTIVLLTWPLLYLVFLFFIPVWPRYLLLLLPFWLLLFLFLVQKNFWPQPRKKARVYLHRAVVFLKKHHRLFLFILAVFIIRTVQFKNFFFTPRQGGDLSTVREMVDYHNFFPQGKVKSLIFYYLCLPFFILTGGHPQATFFWLGTSWELLVIGLVWRRGQELKRGGTALACFYLIFSLLVNSWVWWPQQKLTTRAFRQEPQFFLDTELAVIEGVFRNLKLGEKRFGYYVLNNQLTQEHYHYLFDWYGALNYGGIAAEKEAGGERVVYLIHEEENQPRREELIGAEKLVRVEETLVINGIRVERWSRE